MNHSHVSESYFLSRKAIVRLLDSWLNRKDAFTKRCKKSTKFHCDFQTTFLADSLADRPMLVISSIRCLHDYVFKQGTDVCESLITLKNTFCMWAVSPQQSEKTFLFFCELERSRENICPCDFELTMFYLLVRRQRSGRQSCFRSSTWKHTWFVTVTEYFTSQ